MQVDLGWCRAFFGRAIDLHRRPPLAFLQVVWPNREGGFPWDIAEDDPARRRQPGLWLRPDEHPAGVWTQDL
jgi:hypothetical protein